MNKEPMIIVFDKDILDILLDIGINNNIDTSTIVNDMLREALIARGYNVYGKNN